MVATIVVGTNSYETEVEANAILDEYVHAGPWAFALNKVTSLITAFYDISSSTLTDPDTGAVIDPSDAPLDIKKAQALLAFDFSQKPKLATASGFGGTNVSGVGAGSAKVSFFRPEDTGRWPTIVARLLAPYLGTTDGSIHGSCASGTDGESSFKDEGGGLTEGYK